MKAFALLALALVVAPMSASSLPDSCAAVLCPKPNCLNAVTPPGKCCPVCPPIDCRAVLCLTPPCRNPITPPGSCCPVCPVRCRPNAKYEGCGYKADRTCGKPFPVPLQRPNCKPGCYCKHGYYRDAKKRCVTGRCVQPVCPKGCKIWFDGCNTCSCEKCGTVCTKKFCLRQGKPKCLHDNCRRNFVFKTCTSCQPKCSNLNPICTKECKPPQCVCKAPFALDIFGNCIPAKKCKNCAAVLCPSLKDCPPRYRRQIPGECCGRCTKCEDPLAEFFTAGPCVSSCGDGPCVHIQPGPPGCYCRDSQKMRMRNGKCVLVENCPPCQKPKMKFLRYGLAGFRRCFNPNPARLTANDVARPGCYCKRRYVRDANGDCVRQRTCPKLCPAGCKKYFDGCNTCECTSPGHGSCTEMACKRYLPPKCLETCENVLCPLLACPVGEQMKLNPTDCCPVCNKCALVDCAREIKCSQGVPYVPKGKCCPVCPDCSTVKCASCDSLKCNPDGKGCAYKPGSCCPSCCNKPPDCPGLRCASRLCPNGKTSWGCTGKCYLKKNLQCSGFTPQSVCNKTCLDKLAAKVCQTAASKGGCDRNRIRNLCKKSCGACPE